MPACCIVVLDGRNMKIKNNVQYVRTVRQVCEHCHWRFLTQKDKPMKCPRCWYVSKRVKSLWRKVEVE